ncbi:hypothetical protein ACTFIU_009735 [Dictyostelium citrinum]
MTLSSELSLKVKFPDSLKGKKVMIRLLSMHDSKYTGDIDNTFGDQREVDIPIIKEKYHYSEKEINGFARNTKKESMTFTNKKFTINTSQTLVIINDIKPIKKYDSVIVDNLFGKVLLWSL